MHPKGRIASNAPLESIKTLGSTSGLCLGAAFAFSLKGMPCHRNGSADWPPRGSKPSPDTVPSRRPLPMVRTEAVVPRLWLPGAGISTSGSPLLLKELLVSNPFGTVRSCRDVHRCAPGDRTMDYNPLVGGLLARVTP